MEERVLMTSTRAIKMKTFMIRSSLITLVLAIFFALFMFLPIYEQREYQRDRWDRYDDDWETITVNSYAALDDGEALPIVLLSVGGVCFLYAIITLLIYWCMSKCELLITESSVKGKAMFGIEVTLPLSMITAYKTRKWMSTIIITTASGAVEFAMIENYLAIGNALSYLIRQERMAVVSPVAVAPHAVPTAPAASNNSSMNDLVTLKSYLDQGIITQEEFDAKKKQILGL